MRFSKSLFRFTLVAVLSSVIFAQAPASDQSAKTGFIAADVHTVAASADQRGFGAIPEMNIFEMRGVSMLSLIREAWDTTTDRIVGGPAWLAVDKFDVIAQAPKGSSREEMNKMAKALLMDRFALVVHEDKRDVPSFIITAARGGVKMKKSDGGAESVCKPQENGAAPPDQPVYTTYICRNMTMDAFAHLIPGLAPAYFAGATNVVNKTGLEGGWDFTLHWSARGQLARQGADGIPLFDGIEKQLGLHIESAKASASVIVIDSVNQKPTDNLPGVTVKLPDPPKQFEVATVKPTPPDYNGSSINWQSGRVIIKGIALKSLIHIAWDVDSDDRVAGLPSFATSDKYDIVGQVPAVQVLTPESVQALLKVLLTERFGISTHEETRPVEILALVAAKPKLTKADPANRSDCHAGPGPTPILRTIACQNATLAQLADAITNSARGYTEGKQVVDLTGIAGNYDFSINFSGIALIQSGPGASEAPTDPNGAVSLLNAMEKQYGLKLEKQKKPMPVLVVDHVDRTPADN